MIAWEQKTLGGSQLLTRRIEDTEDLDLHDERSIARGRQKNAPNQIQSIVKIKNLNIQPPPRLKRQSCI